MKKSKTMRIAVLMLALSLLTCCFVGSTFAKYTSTGTGTDSVTVADWEINVGGADIAMTDSVTFDLFNTINDTKDDNEETDVRTGMIAPGTKGSFTLTVNNASDVNAQYKVTFEVYTLNEDDEEVAATFPTNFVFDVNGTKANTLTNVPFTAIAMDATQNVVVNWSWAYETTDGDAADTADGIANTTYYVRATIVAEQVD